MSQEGEKRERETERRERDRKDRRERSKEASPEKKPTKTLEVFISTAGFRIKTPIDLEERLNLVLINLLQELFRKTTTTPSIYWLPLSEEQIKEKEEARNRKIMEADLLR